ncbi:mechanosensitive ion channel family protein [Sphingomonas sp.]|jgi:small-conductance mechanosensitive channel|uniref:mechanosensitive ion channel family protein n=1 Tax=Sphingomonas sp. TaxID=28214 RepID=UPI0035C7D8D1
MSNTSVTKLPAIRAEQVHEQARSFLQTSVSWIQSNWLQVLIAVGIATVIVVGLTAARGLGARLAARSKSGKGWAAIFGRAIQKTNQFFIFMLAARLVVTYAEAPSPVARTVQFLFTVAAVFQAAIWARELILGAIEHRTRSESYNGEALMSALGLIRLLVSFAVFAIALVVVLDNLGVNVTGLVAGLGVGGIAIGLAAQGIFADLFAALAIIFDRPFRRGDNIIYDQTSGTIEAIGLKSTRIRAFTGELRIIANRQLLDKEIQNISDRDHIRVGYTIGVAYETPPETLAKLPAILTELVEAEGGKVARAGFESFGASSLDFSLLVDTPGGDWSVAHGTRDRLLVRIMQRFAEEGISIPYPTQTTYTAAPDGTLVMPYPEPQTVKVAPEQG